MLLQECLNKQTIDLTDEQTWSPKTISILKRGNRYKLFKFIISLKNCYGKRGRIKIPILDEIPNIEVEGIHSKQCGKLLIKALASKLRIDNKQDLIRMLYTDIDPQKNT